MNIDELRILFAEMQKAGLNPLYCDTDLPKYDSNVPCGNPNFCHEDIAEYVTLPKELLSMHPEFFMTVKGDSMKDAGIETGDVVRIIGDVQSHDGDIVLASIDGEYTLKTYFEDDEGLVWLIPQNEKYRPIKLTGQFNVKIIGRVKEIIKTTPRVSHRDCMKAIRKVKAEEAVTHVITQQAVSAAIRGIAPMIKMGRHWYAVYRVLADNNVVKEDDFDTFIEMVVAEVPNHKNPPKRLELQRIATLSFAKPVKRWRVDNAPVNKTRFYNYMNIAKNMQELLGVS